MRCEFGIERRGGRRCDRAMRGDILQRIDTACCKIGLPPQLPLRMNAELQIIAGAGTEIVG